MSESKSSSSPNHHNVTLHIWPAYGDLLSLDVSSVAALLYLQLTIPGHFSLAYCSNLDSSPTGHLPFITHGLHHASGLGSIIAYVRILHDVHPLDGQLNAVQNAQITARVAHVESAYGDLVNHMLYSLQENWYKVTRPALVSMLPVPQRYYVPSRIRTSYKSRLEAAELWHVPEDEGKPEEPRKVFGRRKKPRSSTEPRDFQPTAEREKVIEKARSVFNVYNTLLGDNRFFMGSETPTSLDVVFAAHTYLLLNLHFPDTLVTSVLQDSYPAFISHCTAVVSAALPSPEQLPPTVQNSRLSSLKYIIPWPRSPARRSASSALEQSPEIQREEWRYKLWRWGFIGTSILAAAAYLHFATIVILVRYPNASPQLPPQEGREEDAEDSEDDSED